jgi:hypothetical protein
MVSKKCSFSDESDQFSDNKSDIGGFWRTASRGASHDAINQNDCHLQGEKGGQNSFLGNSTVRRPRLSVGSSFLRCSRRVVRVLKLCHDLVKANFVREWLARANVFFAN